jgi:polysaccharide deacetylase family protein (PEP-CTERM system associated)
MLNALTVDVEDYYQVSAFERRIPRADWDQWESRVVANTQRVLALCRDHGVRGTFFVLGWVAERFPELVRDIDAQGHEIGSHSYWHQLIYELSPEQFRADLRQSKAVLHGILGRPVTLYRAPSFSITPASRWALEILADEGFRTDSSIFPVRHDRYGMRDAPLDPHDYEFDGRRLSEFPASAYCVAGCRLPASGGGYFRLYPLRLTLAAARQANRRGRPYMFYIHPWELDPRQPRVPGVGLRSRFRHYVNLNRVEGKLRRLLATLPFGTLSQSLELHASAGAAATLGEHTAAQGLRPSASLNTPLVGAPTSHS